LVRNLRSSREPGGFSDGQLPSLDVAVRRGSRRSKRAIDRIAGFGGRSYNWHQRIRQRKRLGRAPSRRAPDIATNSVRGVTRSPSRSICPPDPERYGLLRRLVPPSIRADGRHRLL